MAQNTGLRGGSAIDGRTTRHPGYALSQRTRKRVEEIFGWLKTVGGMRKTRFRGKARVGWMLTWALAAYNLVRLRNLLREAEGEGEVSSEREHSALGGHGSPPRKGLRPLLEHLETLDSAEFYF